jgi:hypothetical protein
MNQDYKKIIKISSITVLFLFIILYAFFRSKDLVFGVHIKDVNLVDGKKVENNIINVSGNAKNAVILTLNGREISIDQNGNWNETIVVLPGYNVVKINAKDKFGHTDEKNYKLIL